MLYSVTLKHPKDRSWLWPHLASARVWNQQGCSPCSGRRSVWWSRTGPGDGLCGTDALLCTLYRWSCDLVFHLLLSNPVQMTALPDKRSQQKHVQPSSLKQKQPYISRSSHKHTLHSLACQGILFCKICFDLVCRSLLIRGLTGNLLRNTASLTVELNIWSNPLLEDIKI